MLQTIYTIYDSKSRIYSPPHLAVNEQVAIRSVAEVVNSPGTPLNSNPQDYTLFCIGTYDDNTATITNYDALETVIRLHELKTIDRLTPPEAES